MPPFRISSAPRTAPPTQQAAREAPSPTAGQLAVEAQRRGIPIPTAQEAAGVAHGHSPVIPFPPAGGPDDRTPMKGLK